ncbi:MAG: DUF4159 domain-containing protein [Methylacidiphilales bacterium]|nr:DUF4159 domain-containing protein [Candidatus Methylacidiphilales bacterium]
MAAKKPAKPDKAAKTEKKPAGAMSASDRVWYWRNKISRSGYFFAALLLHLIIFAMVATWVIWKPFTPPADDFTKTFLPPSAPPPPPPSAQVAVQMPTHTIIPPAPVISTSAPSVDFSIPLPDFSHNVVPDNNPQRMTQRVAAPSNTISDLRLASIKETEKMWGRTTENILESNSDPRNVVAKFPVYLASYANGDWGCNTRMVDGKIDAGSLPNLVAKINEWSRGNIKGEVVPDPLDIGGPDLMAKRPPFIFFTGHKDFVLTDQEIDNLRNYLQVGGCVWGDNALAGRGSRFDVAFRREMKRVIPDADKDFEPLPMTDDIFTKSWYNITKQPTGMNYYQEPVEHIDIDGKLAVLYTPNDYSDMFFMRILPGDKEIYAPDVPPPHTLFTDQQFNYGNKVFFRNFELDSCLAVQQFGMNVIGYMLVRFDKDLLLTP